MIRTTHITAACAVIAALFSFLAWTNAAEARELTQELKSRAVQDRIVMRQPDQQAEWETSLGITIRVSVYCDEENVPHDCGAVLEDRVKSVLDQGMAPKPDKP